MMPAATAAIAAALDLGTPRDVSTVAGGDIHAAWRLVFDDRFVFVKTGARDALPMLETEARALVRIEATDTVAVPGVLGRGIAADTAWLALEWIEFRSASDKHAARLGTALAELHRESAPQFGFDEDNFIGRTPQPNDWSEDWRTFFGERRLAFQLALARDDGHADISAAAIPLLERLDQFLDEAVQPSLLHGDLWGGNWGVDNDGQPVLFDPASYFGDRETDLAMTELFGGFPAAFYAAYDEAWPRSDGYRRRRPLYQLYHALNHLHLFGAGYRGLCQRLIDEGKRWL